MLRFQHIEYLWLLLLVLAMIVLLLVYHQWKKKRREAFAQADLLDVIAGSHSTRKNVWKSILFLLSFTCLVIGIANPQIGSKTETVKSQGADIMIALDVSNSMNAKDITPSRLERSKMVMNQLIHQLKGDRIGIVVFAGQSFVQLPITSDYSAAKLFLPTIHSDVVPVQGTAIGDAIDLCVSSFDEKSQAGKAIIVISDGENHEDDAVKAAKNAKKKGIVVHTIGMGSKEGAPIPVLKKGKQTGYMSDEDGGSVITKLDPEMLTEIAEAADGSFVRATNTDGGLGFILSKIDKMKKSENKTQMYTGFESRFQIFIGLAILFLLLEILISTKKSAWMDSVQLFKIKEKDA